MKRKSIMIDMDEVIVKCRFTDFIKDFLGKEYDLSKLDSYYRQDLIKGRELEFAEKYSERSLYKNDDGSFVEPLPNCIETIKKLNDVYDVYIVSAYYWKGDVIDSGFNLKHKMDYLLYYFPFLNPDNFIFTSNKTMKKFNIGIDDRLINLESCDMKLLFTEFRNENISNKELLELNVTRVNNWLKIEEKLLKFENV